MTKAERICKEFGESEQEMNKAVIQINWGKLRIYSKKGEAVLQIGNAEIKAQEVPKIMAFLKEYFEDEK